MDMLKELDLSTEQQAAIKAIRKDTHTQMEALREKSDDRAANREAAQSIREKSKTAVLQVLTPAQRTALEEKQKARKEAWEKVDKKAMSAEIKAYREREIQPVMRASRGQLDQFISAEDQQEIDRLRGVFASKPKRAGKDGGHRRGGAEKDKAAGDNDRTANHEAANQWRADHAADIASLEQLTEKYGTELKRVQQVLEGRRETWNREMAEIKAKYLPEGASPRGPKGRNGEKGRKGGKSKKGEEGEKDRKKGEQRGKMKGSAFLLMKS